MSTTLTTLGTDDVHTGIKALLHVLGVANHVHVWDSGFVESLNDLLWWGTDGGDKERDFFCDDDVDELIELALGVVIVCSPKRIRKLIPQSF